jgi:branched-chain amino acid transport system substrate-binding protein
MKKVLCTVLALAMTLSLAACGGGGTSTPAANGSGSGNASTPASSASGETIKIGYFTDMSSADGYIGMAGYYALEDRIEELNANGGLLGQQIELIAYDNAGKNEEVVNIVNKLCYADKVNVIIGPTSSSHAISAAPIVNEAQIPMISLSATNAAVTVDNDGNVQPYVFRVCFIDPYQGTAMADFAYNDLDNPVIGTLAPLEDSYAQGLKTYFIEQYTQIGGTVSKDLGYRAGEVEFRAQLTDMANSGVEVVFVPCTAYKDAAFMVQQATDLGYDFTWLFGDAVYSQEMLDNVGDLLNGKCYLSNGITDIDGTYDDYYAAFNAKHTNQTANIYALYAMDCMAATEYAITNGNSTDPNSIRDQFENMENVPLFTFTMTMEKDTHNPHNKPVSIMTIEDGAYKLFKEYVPSN